MHCAVPSQIKLLDHNAEVTGHLEIKKYQIKDLKYFMLQFTTMYILTTFCEADILAEMRFHFMWNRTTSIIVLLRFLWGRNWSWKWGFVLFETISRRSSSYFALSLERTKLTRMQFSTIRTNQLDEFVAITISMSLKICSMTLLARHREKWVSVHSLLILCYREIHNFSTWSLKQNQ